MGLPLTFAKWLRDFLSIQPIRVHINGDQGHGQNHRKTIAIVPIVGDPADSVIIHKPKARGSELTSSYEEEKATLPLALDWARANCPTERISICSDIQSLLKASQGGAHDIQSFASD